MSTISPLVGVAASRADALTRWWPPESIVITILPMLLRRQSCRRHRGLADAAGADDGEEAVGIEMAGQQGDGLGAADHPGPQRGQAGMGHRGGKIGRAHV